MGAIVETLEYAHDQNDKLANTPKLFLTNQNLVLFKLSLSENYLSW